MRAEYERRSGERREAAVGHQRLSQRLSNARLLTVIAGAILGWWNPWLLPIPVIAFVALLIFHERVENNAAHELRAIAYYERSIARVDGRWSGFGETGANFLDPSHPYASDLDLFGQGSVFQLINAARTAAGETTLAQWLMGPGELPSVLKRQAAVLDLRERLDLREDLALLGEDVRAGVHPESLVRWGDRAPERVTTAGRITAAALAILTVIAAIGALFQLWSFRVPLFTVLLQSIFAFAMRDRVLRILAAVNLPAHDLAVLAAVLERFEREPFLSERLIELKKQLESEGLPPSRQIARLHRLVDLHDSVRNQMFAPFAKLVLWSTQFAFAIERWRQTSGPHLSQWISAIGELEALSSLSGYAAENRNDPFAEIIEEGPFVDAVGITHPLLGPAAVRNDVRLDREHQLLLVSGSNMSGKSTLLRSVGLNVVLAWAGAPVRAERMRVSCLHVGAAMRVQDSLQDGKSRFYAEITRLRQIVDMASGSQPLLFLLDELLSGTNSHDRRIGAEAIVRALVEKGGIGLVTTHDLALARIVDTLGRRAENVHFADHIENGHIAFDYKMRAGVVEKSNALELMRSIGLEV